MFKDTERELERLDGELRAEEQPEELTDEDLAELEALLEEDDQKIGGSGPYVYKNYSNRYGADLRNYASGYRAANTDVTDTDLEEFSKAVEKPRKENLTGLALTALILAGGIIIVLVWWLVKFF